MTSPLVIDGAAIATVNRTNTEYAVGHLIANEGRIISVGPGPAPEVAKARRVDGTGCLLTPGLVNTHHHLYQWATRGYAQQSTLFAWLTELYPVWANINVDIVAAASTAGLAWLAKSGCSTTTDHHYVFPQGAGDLLASTVESARRVGLRFHPCRGSMDVGQSHGGLPPDNLVEPLDAILSATQDAIEHFHDPKPGAMVRIAVAPCSPFSVSTDLLRESAALARDFGVRLHTHLAETLDEEDYCQRLYGRSPVEYLDQLDWLGEDVWLAHAVHLSPRAIARLGATRTGVAHCPSSNARLGAGIAPVSALLAAGVPVGLGVDGAASGESGRLVEELRQALYLGRLRSVDGPAGRSGPEVPTGPAALTARQVLTMACMGGARCLGRADEIGSLEPGKLADLALWRVNGLGHAGISDPVAALVFGSAAPLELLTVGGTIVVERDELRTVDETDVTLRLARAARAARAGMPR